MAVCRYDSSPGGCKNPRCTYTHQNARYQQSNAASAGQRSRPSSSAHTPAEAIRRFLSDNYRFRSTNDIYEFLAILHKAAEAQASSSAEYSVVGIHFIR